MATTVLVPAKNHSTKTMQLVAVSSSQSNHLNCGYCGRPHGVKVAKLPLQKKLESLLARRFSAIHDPAMCELWNSRLDDFTETINVTEWCDCEPHGSLITVDILSPAETDIACEIFIGGGSKQIADRLGRSARTVEKHKENLSRKLASDLSPYAISNVVFGVIQCRALVDKFL